MLKKAFSSLLLAVAACLVFSGLALAGSPSGPTAQPDNLCKGVDLDFINSHSPYAFQEIVEKRPFKDQNLCYAVGIIQGEYVPILIPSTRNAIILGDLMINRQSPTRDIIEDIQAKEIAKNKGEMEKATAFSLKPQGATKYIYEFTDPMCPYCEKAKKPLKDWAENNKVEVRVILFPLPMHKGSKEMAIAGICAGMNYDDYMAGKYTGSQCEEGKNKIDAALSLASKIGVNGTPTFVGANGRKVTGFMPDQLMKLVQ